MPHVEIEIRLWVKLEEPTADIRNEPAGWYMGVTKRQGLKFETLAVEHLSVMQVARIARAVKMNGERNCDLMPWITQMNDEVIASLDKQLEHQRKVNERNLEVIGDLAKIMETRR